MSSGRYSGCKEKTLTYRAAFARRWQKFIRDNFDTPKQASAAFYVDVSTAENWFAGSNAPQGWVVGRALTDRDLRWGAMQALAEDEQ